MEDGQNPTNIASYVPAELGAARSSEGAISESSRPGAETARACNDKLIYAADLGGGSLEGYNACVEKAGERMTVQTLKLGRERYVLMKEKDYRDLKAKARPVRTGRRLTAQDRGDIAEAQRRSHEPVRPYAELRKELGLA